MKEINEVKKDLRELKHHAHAIEKLKMAQNTHLARISMLERMEKTDKIKEIIECERRHIELLPISEEIERARLLEEKYIDAISTLGPIEKSIIIDTYINGIPYWKIGITLGYSEEGIRKRLAKALKEIASYTSISSL